MRSSANVGANIVREDIDDEDDVFCSDEDINVIDSVVSELSKKGYRDRMAKEEERIRQEAFDEGLRKGIILGESAGRVYAAIKHATLVDGLIAPSAANRACALLLESLGQSTEMEELGTLIASFPQDIVSAYELYRSLLPHSALPL